MTLAFNCGLCCRMRPMSLASSRHLVGNCASIISQSAISAESFIASCVAPCRGRGPSFCLTPMGGTARWCLWCGRCLLQWGRRSKTAEGNARRGCPRTSAKCFNGAAVRKRRRVGQPTRPSAAVPSVASMGPPFKTASGFTATTCPISCKLQWGRRSKTAEGLMCAKCQHHVPSCLEWGRPFENGGGREKESLPRT